MLDRRRGAVALAASLLFVALGLGAWRLVTSNQVEMCGERLVAVEGLELVDWGDRFGESLTVSRRALPVDSRPVPREIEEVLVAPSGFEIEPDYSEAGDGSVDLGALRSPDGSCRVHVGVLTNDAMEPGVERNEGVRWYALIFEGI